jgi:hypothetical protein
MVFSHDRKAPRPKNDLKLGKGIRSGQKILMVMLGGGIVFAVKPVQNKVKELGFQEKMI